MGGVLLYWLFASVDFSTAHARTKIARRGSLIPETLHPNACLRVDEGLRLRTKSRGSVVEKAMKYFLSMTMAAGWLCIAVAAFAQSTATQTTAPVGSAAATTSAPAGPVLVMRE
jgi:hypothetical protein